MATFPLVPRAGAESLCLALTMLRDETMAGCLSGSLSVCADDLLGAAGSVESWLDDLDRAVRSDHGPCMALPDREEWELRHVVYTISAVLVWADSLHREGTLAAMVPTAALEAWAIVEAAAGMTGRTDRALRLAGATSVPARPPMAVLALEETRPRLTRLVRTDDAALSRV